MTLNLRLTKKEADILLKWHSIQKRRYQRYGSSEYIFPQEEWLINSLKNYPEEKEFDDMDLEIFLDWMHHATQPLPGNNPIYFPEENSLILKLENAEKAVEDKKSEMPVENQSARIIEYKNAATNKNNFKDLFKRISLKIKHHLKNSRLQY